MKQIITVCMYLGILVGSAQEKRQVGGPCEGCEAALEYVNKLNAIDTLLGFTDNIPKMKVTGVVYKADQKTPAEGVILYIYHTNRKGIYPPAKEANGWGRRHGMHQGWIKTGADGKYTFYTFEPASYPSGKGPAHIHLTVKEPGINPYYVDSYFFANDPLLTNEFINGLSNRGGSGVIQITEDNQSLAVVKRDIILGLNIPNYEN